MFKDHTGNIPKLHLSCVYVVLYIYCYLFLFSVCLSPSEEITNKEIKQNGDLIIIFKLTLSLLVGR